MKIVVIKNMKIVVKYLEFKIFVIKKIVNIYVKYLELIKL